MKLSKNLYNIPKNHHAKFQADIPTPSSPFRVFWSSVLDFSSFFFGGNPNSFFGFRQNCILFEVMGNQCNVAKLQSGRLSDVASCKLYAARCTLHIAPSVCNNHNKFQLSFAFGKAKHPPNMNYISNPPDSQPSPIPPPLPVAPWVPFLGRSAPVSGTVAGPLLLLSHLNALWVVRLPVLSLLHLMSLLLLCVIVGRCKRLFWPSAEETD